MRRKLAALLAAAFAVAVLASPAWAGSHPSGRSGSTIIANRY
jgi:hypothetical protein